MPFESMLHVLHGNKVIFIVIVIHSSLSFYFDITYVINILGLLDIVSIIKFLVTVNSTPGIHISE